MYASVTFSCSLIFYLIGMCVMLLYNVTVAQQTAAISRHTHSLVNCYNSGEWSVVIHCVK